MPYSWSFNFALGALGFDPRTINEIHRQAAIITGRANDNSPQETALLLVASMHILDRADTTTDITRKWVRKRKIDPSKQEVSEALLALGCYAHATSGQ